MLDWSTETFAAATTKTANFEGDQPQTITVTVTLDANANWYCVAPANVNVVLGKKETVTLHFKPKPWVKFKVVEDVTDTQLAGLTLKYTSPSGQLTKVTTANATTDSLKLVPTDITCSADELDNTVDAEVWEFVRIESDP